MMTVADVMAKISTHMIEGMMFHEQMSEYYRFLGMNNYADSHDWHYNQESTMYKFIRDYYIDHYNRLVPKVGAHNPNAVPDAWYRYAREDVDPTVKKNAVKNGLATWKNWEEETKELYQSLYYELLNIKEIAFANAVNSLITSVDIELADVTSYCIRHKTTDYDLDLIMAEN